MAMDAPAASRRSTARRLAVRSCGSSAWLRPRAPRLRSVQPRPGQSRAARPFCRSSLARQSRRALRLSVGAESRRGWRVVSPAARPWWRPWASPSGWRRRRPAASAPSPRGCRRTGPSSFVLTSAMTPRPNCATLPVMLRSVVTVHLVMDGDCTEASCAVMLASALPLPPVSRPLARSTARWAVVVLLDELRLALELGE